MINNKWLASLTAAHFHKTPTMLAGGGRSHADNLDADAWPVFAV